MVGDPVIGRILDERAVDLASGPRDEDGAQDWFATRLSTHQPSGLAGSVDTGHPTLFTGVLGMVILRSSYPGSCIESRPRAARMASAAPRATRVGTTCCGGA